MLKKPYPPRVSDGMHRHPLTYFNSVPDLHQSKAVFRVDVIQKEGVDQSSVLLIDSKGYQ